VRKKAKYLHDAPNEALMPGVGPNLYNHPQPKRNSSVNNGSPEHNHQSQPTSQPQQFFPSSNFPFYPTSTEMPPPMLSTRTMSDSNFSKQSPLTPAFNTHNPLQSPNPQDTQNLTAQWAGNLFDDPSMFNFDISSMNFGNHYGALEFGMLGQMAGNAGETPPSEAGTQRGSVHNPYRVPMGSFSESPNATFANYNNDAMMSDWSNGSGMYNNQLQGPHAFAIESNAQFHSPENHATPPDGVKFDDSPLLTGSALKPPLSSISGGPVQQAPNNQPPQARRPTQISTPQLKAKSQLPVKTAKKPRDPSAIYTNVTTPHPYTTNFHALIAYLQKRFSSHPSKTLAIAQS
jgi:hypothetical protein